MVKILLLDIETAPNLAYVWGAWKQNVGLNQWVKKREILSIALKWLGKENDPIFLGTDKYTEKVILQALTLMLDSADIVVTHNGKKFDMPIIQARMLVHGLKPPSPYHQVDTCQIAKREFGFVTNNLANIADELGCKPKDRHEKFPGFELWAECLKDNSEAWDEMEKYNKEDVLVLEEIYLKMRPYIRNHPNVARGDGVACPKCGSRNIQYRGYYYTAAGLAYRRFVCKDCGGWGRERCKDKDIPTNDGRNAR